MLLNLRRLDRRFLAPQTNTDSPMVTRLYSNSVVRQRQTHFHRQSAPLPVRWRSCTTTVVGANGHASNRLPSYHVVKASYSMKLALVHPSWGTARKQRTLWPRSTLCEGNSSTVLVNTVSETPKSTPWCWLEGSGVTVPKHRAQRQVLNIHHCPPIWQGRKVTFVGKRRRWGSATGVPTFKGRLTFPPGTQDLDSGGHSQNC